MQTLVLNSYMMPIRIVPWQDAICLWFTEKAEILASYEDKQLNSWSSAMDMPAVVRLLHFARPPKRLVYEVFNRRNVYKRDRGRCQYCNANLAYKKKEGKKKAGKEFTFDHVIPREQGGATSWKNIVSACVACNLKKRNRTPAQANMRLLSSPIVPKVDIGDKIRLRNFKNVLHKSWKDYIYWNVELESD